MERGSRQIVPDGPDAGLTGLILLEENAEAYSARLLSARGATATLDLMYYIWRDDACGRALLAEVSAAADRGVSVRLLIDDINPLESDRAYLRLNSHPNIQLRLFNPSAIRRRGMVRWVEMVFRFGALNRRMHAKAWITDRRVAIVGGRNIGDEYFGKASTNFRDLDLLVMGRAVQQTTEIFELFWNHALSHPVHRLNRVRKRLRGAERSVAVAVETESPAETRRSIDDFIADCSAMHWVRDATVLADPPDKAQRRGKRNWLMKTLLPVIRSAERRVEIISPYFIPGRRGIHVLSGLVKRGVVVTVLTNSLAATDVAPVHGAYANYRKRLLRAGVNLFEFQPFARGRNRISVFGSKGASLHTKAFVIDDRTGFVGSFNFDPRSVSLNVEMGILVRDEAVVKDLLERVDEEKQADASYWVDLDRGLLRWTGIYKGKLRRFRSEPEAGLARRLLAAVVRWLPIESHL